MVLLKCCWGAGSVSIPSWAVYESRTIREAGASSLLRETRAEDSPGILHQSPSKGLSSLQRNGPFRCQCLIPATSSCVKTQCNLPNSCCREAFVFYVGCLGEVWNSLLIRVLEREGMNFASRLIVHATKQSHLTSLEPEAVETILKQKL